MQWVSSKRLREAPVDCVWWDQVELSVSPGAMRRGLFDRYSIDLNGHNAEVFHRAADVLLSYRIFPPSRLQAFICNPERRAALGATIVQRVLLGPIGFEVATRVTDVFDVENGGEHRVGFTYATLRGHPERGIATFTVRREELSGRVSFTIETWSRPGNWLSVALRPLARFIQKQSNKEALVYVRTLVATQQLESKL